MHGESALGNDRRKSDFTLINQEKFAFVRSDEFGRFRLVARQEMALLKFLIKALWPVWRACPHCANAQDRQQTAQRFHDEALFSNVPMACGPYARYGCSLVPADSNGKATPAPTRTGAAISAPVCGSRRCTGT